MATQKIHAPNGASVSTISVLPEHALQLDFDTTDTAVDRIGNDLSINFSDGGSVVLDDFFVTNGADLPMLILSDGVEISSAELLQNLNPDLDLTTAAGPTARADGSGSGEYGDGAGDLLGGLDRLGDLGTFGWDRDIATSNASETGMASTAGEGDMLSQAPAIPAIPDNPEEEPEGMVPIIREATYIARSVVDPTVAMDYQHAQSGFITFKFIDANNNFVTDLPEFNFLEDITGDTEFFDLSHKWNGELVYMSDPSLKRLYLSGKGMELLRTMEPGVLEKYLTFHVDGREYTVQIVFDNADSYVSQGPDGKLPDNMEGLFEWHNREMVQSHDLTGSDDADSYYLKTYAGSERENMSIHTGKGDDIILFDGPLNTVENQTTDINFGENGNNMLAIDGTPWWDTSSNGKLNITFADGDDKFGIGEAPRITTHDDAVSTIDMGHGDNEAYINFLTAYENGKNEFLFGDGNDHVETTFAVSASDSGSNSFNLGDGENTFQAGHGVGASDNGSNTVVFGDGNNTLTTSSISAGNYSNPDNIHYEAKNEFIFGEGTNSLSAGSILAQNGGTNLIEMSGDNTIFVGSEITATNGGKNMIITHDGQDSLTVEGLIVGSEVNLGGGDDYLRLSAQYTNSKGKIYLSEKNTLDGGAGDDDVLHLNAENADAFSNFFDNNEVSGFERLIADFTNSKANESISLDDLLNSAKGMELFIKGDVGKDSVSTDGWQVTGETHTDDDGITYSAYTNGTEEDAATVWIQSQLILNSSGG